MRYELQPWDKLRLTCEIIVNGRPITGATVSARVRRMSDDTYWDGSQWTTVSSVALAEFDATRFPGLYVYELPDDAQDPKEQEEYYAVIACATPDFLEYVRIVGQSVFSDTLSGADRDNVAAAIQALAFSSVAVHDAVDSGTKWFLMTTTAHANRFTPSNVTGTYPVGDETWWIGRSCGLARPSAGSVTPVRIQSVSAGYFVLETEEGEDPVDGIESGDMLVVGLRWDTSPAYLMRASVDGVDAAVGTLADALQRMLRLRQHNTRVQYTAYNAQGRPTTGYVLVYASQADCDADTGPSWALATGRYDFTQSYDGQGRVTSYKSTKTS